MIFYVLWCACALTLCSTECFRILQNSNYMPWRGYYKIVASWYFVCLCCLGAFSALWQLHFPYPVVLCGVYTLTAIPMFFVRRKVPLKLTKRIFRMLITEFVVLAIACWFCLCVWVILLPLFAVIAWLICLPLDLAISKYYIAIAQKKLAQSRVDVIAITGSFGKTSTKSMLTTLLNGSIAPSGSCNTPLGIAKYINGADLSSAQYLILEFGARKRGDIEKLCKLFPPQHGIVTGVCPQHLRTFGSFSGIVSEKGKLVEYLSQNGVCILANNSVDYYSQIGSCEKVGSVVGVSQASINLHGVRFTAKYDNCFAEIHLPQISSYSVDTFCVCATLCLKLGQSFEDIVENARFIRQCPHRLEVKHNGRFYIIDDSYNASVEGVNACCDVLERLDVRKIVVSQGIVECGTDSYKTNFETGQKLGSACDVFVACGKNKKALCAGASDVGCNVVRKTKKLNDAVDFLRKYVCVDCVVLFQNDLPDVVNI